jgi:WD40 repeat protein
LWKEEKKSDKIQFKPEKKFECVDTVKLHDRSIYTVAWNKQNNLVATGSGDDTIKILRMEGDKLHVIQTIECTTEINSVAWNGNTVAAADDIGQVSLYVINT